MRANSILKYFLKKSLSRRGSRLSGTETDISISLEQDEAWKFYKDVQELTTQQPMTEM